MRLTETQRRFREAMTQANRPCPHEQYNMLTERSILETIYSVRQIIIVGWGVFLVFLLLNYHSVYDQNALVGPLYSQAYVKDRILSSDDNFVIYALVETMQDVEKVAHHIEVYQHLPIDQQDAGLCQTTVDNGIITTNLAQGELKLLQRQSSPFLRTLFPVANDYITLVKGACLNWQSGVSDRNPQKYTKRSAAFLASAKNKHDQFMTELTKLQAGSTKTTQ